MASKYFKEMYQKTSPESKVFTSMSFDIIDQISYILKDKGVSQRELAKRLGKSESEISKWLSPGHNLTLKTLAKITVALDETIIETPEKHTSEAKIVPFRIPAKKGTPGNRRVNFIHSN